MYNTVYSYPQLSGQDYEWKLKVKTFALSGFEEVSGSVTIRVHSHLSKFQFLTSKVVMQDNIALQITLKIRKSVPEVSTIELSQSPESSRFCQHYAFEVTSARKIWATKFGVRGGARASLLYPLLDPRGNKT